MSTLAATTTTTAATHGDIFGWLVTAAIAALVIVTIGYGLKCWLFPFTTCHHTSSGSLRCRRCEGTGRRVRAGRRLLNHIRTAHSRHH